MNPRNKPLYYLALFATALALVVVILGAYTRLKDAGLGCPDWPGCYGHFYMPGSAEEIAAADELFPDMPFEADKAWPEVIHRYFASGLGLVILVIAFLSFRRSRSIRPSRSISRDRSFEGGRESEVPLKLPLFLVVLVIWQGLFGMWTVTLKLWPQVVTTHLLGGFTTLSLLWLLSLRLKQNPLQRPLVNSNKMGRLKVLSMLGLIVVIIQIALGGWVSSNYAALACPDLPTCQNQWWPTMNFATGFNIFQDIGPNYLGGVLDAQSRIAIHMAHRIGAVVTTLYLLFLLFQVRGYSANSRLNRLSWIILALLLVQLGLGLSNIVWQIPLPVATAHNAVGALLLVAMVTLNYRLYTSSTEKL